MYFLERHSTSPHKIMCLYCSVEKVLVPSRVLKPREHYGEHLSSEEVAELSEHSVYCGAQ
jgi:hypothetical protein